MNNPSYHRIEYGKLKLKEHDLPGSPFELFEKWLTDAFNNDLPEPTAMTLATCGSNGRISSRIILLKGYNTGGFQFYTNYNSHKGRDLNKNNTAAMNFYWPELERQVRIEGQVNKITSKDSDLYHATRPRNNQLSAWASEQSSPVTNRKTLEARFKAVSKVYESYDIIPRPPQWGGFQLVPDRIEFWQGRENRLHDRINYTREQSGKWTKQRLNP